MNEFVIETVKVSGDDGLDEQIDEYLKLGWVIVKAWIVGFVVENGHETQIPSVLLGWINRCTRVAHPAKPAEQQPPLTRTFLGSASVIKEDIASGPRTWNLKKRPH